MYPTDVVSPFLYDSLDNNKQNIYRNLFLFLGDLCG